MQDVPRRPVITVLSDPAVAYPSDLGELPDQVDVRTADEASFADAVDGAHVVLMWDFFSGALREVWPRAGSVRWVHVAAAGVDTLLFDELVDSEVVVTNARGVFDRPIAEFVLASILACAKDLHGSHDYQLQRVWRHRETRSVVGATALIVGTGGIGRETARLLRSLGVSVTGAGRTARSDDPDFGEIVASRDLAGVVSDVDHLVVAAPLTEQTRGLVGAAVFDAIKPGAHLVNVGRGPIVDEAALAAALRSGRLAAASLDVFATEPLPADSPLWSLPGVAISAHMSGDVVGWRASLARQFVDNVQRWLDGQPLLNVVDKRLGFVSSAGIGDRP